MNFFERKKYVLKESLISKEYSNNFLLFYNEKKEVLKLLKKKLACGGSISDEWLELQGDVKEKIKTVLEADGWKFRK